MFRISLYMLIMLSGIFAFASIPVTENGKPAAEIIVSENADQTVKFAAAELKFWIEKISGTSLPIKEKPGNAKTKIFLTHSRNTLNKFPVDAEKLQDNDGYAVRQKDGDVYLFASQPKGVLNGVYRLLFNNSDIIWARPDENFGTVYTPNPNFSLTKTDYIDIPVYKLRGWQTLGRITNLWQMRNGCNWTAVDVNDPEKRTHGMILEFGGGHNLNTVYITEQEYYHEHPDFFPLIKGERKRPSTTKALTQLCFANDRMTEAFIKKLDQLIEANPQYETYRIMTEDNWDFCECPACRRAIVLHDGKTLSPNAKNFYSTRFFLWLNRIAEHLQKHHPGKRILTFAYFFTEVPPAVKVASNIDISFCSIFRNSKFPFNTQENAKVNQALTDWLRNTPNITLREYYGLTDGVPRPVDAVAVADWRYANQNGVTKTYSEISLDDPARMRWGGAAWDANAMYFWVMTNAVWNPYRNVEEYRDEFLNRAFGPAANDMKEYYRIIEEEWHKNPSCSTCDDDALAVWKYLLTPDVKSRCHQALEHAEKKVQHPNSRKMVERARDNFLQAVKMTESIEVHAWQAAKPPVFDPDFASGEWAGRKPETRFLVHPGGKTHDNPTEVKILYDSENIYFGIKCLHRAPHEMRYRKTTESGNVFPYGEGFEVFISANWRNRQGYAQVAVDPSNNRYWSFGGDKAWTGKWSSDACVTQDGWSAMIMIPWKELGIDIESAPSLTCALIRQYRQATPPSAPSIAVHLFGTARHRLNTFVPLILGK